MSVLANRPEPKQPRPRAPRVFQIHFVIEADEYAISAHDADPEVARKAFRFRKLTGDQAVYDVRFTEHGPECDCLGFLKWGKCKHCSTLAAAAKVFAVN